MFTKKEKDFIRNLLKTEMEEEYADLNFNLRNGFRNLFLENEEKISELEIMIGKLDEEN